MGYSSVLHNFLYTETIFCKNHEIRSRCLLCLLQFCKDIDELENLKHMMELYTHGTFGKDSYQWTKCVIKYVYDVYTDVGDAVIPFLVDVSYSMLH